MGSLSRWRQPVAQVVLLVGLGYIVLSVVTVIRGVVSQNQTLPTMARVVGGGSLTIPIIIVIVATALACSHLQPPTPRAHQILGWAGRLVALGALMELVLMILGLFSPRSNGIGTIFEVLGGLLSIAIKSAAAAVLFLARRTVPESAPVAQASASAPGQEIAVAPDQPDDASDTIAASWRPEEAVGSVWTRAGDAATGAAGQSVRGQSGTSASSGGWQTGWNAAPTNSPTSSAPTTSTPPTSPWSAGAWSAGQQQLPPIDPDNPDDLGGPAVPGTGWDPLPRQ